MKRKLNQYQELAKQINARIRSFKKVFGEKTNLPFELAKHAGLNIEDDYISDRGYLKPSAFENADMSRNLKNFTQGLKATISSPMKLYKSALGAIKEQALVEKELKDTSISAIEKEVINKEMLQNQWGRIRNRWYNKYGGVTGESEFTKFYKGKKNKEAYDAFYGRRGTYYAPDSTEELIKEINIFRRTLQS